MTEWTHDPAEAGDWETEPGEWAGETDPAVDYQLREMEARLDRRLATMEARHARTRGVAMVAGAAFIVTLVSLVVVVGKAVTDDGIRTLQSLTAQEIMLRDDDGIERGRLGTDSEGRAVLSLSDRDGRERIRLTVLADGSPGVTIHDPDAQPRAVLGYLPDGTTNLIFTDRSGAIRTLVGVGPNGEPSVSVFDEETEDETTQEP
jgi:hypothetical protein